jgi:hypothetical protein
VDPADIDHRFAFHPADNDEKRNAHGSIRELHRQLAHAINEKVPDGREKSLSITHLEDSMMWANAGIARGMAERQPVAHHPV